MSFQNAEFPKGVGKYLLQSQERGKIFSAVQKAWKNI